MKKCLLITILLLAVSIAHAQDATPTPTPVWPRQYYAPYVEPGALPLAVTAENTGIRFYTLAFILAGGDCQAAWGGASLLKNMPFLNADLEKLRAAGGDVLVSFGGANGDELALVCPDVESLTEAYQAVIDAYDLTLLDFDIEGDEIHDSESIDRRSQAIAALQSRASDEGRELSVAFTLSVLPTGLPDAGLALLQSALDHGVVFDVVNIMTMNFGADFPPDAMGDNTIQAATSLHGQLQELYPDADDETLWGMIGLTPMIGLNDVSPEVFTQEDAAAVTTFAQEQGVRRISIWSLSRDQECIAAQAVVSNRCSGTLQEPLAFSSIFNVLNESE